MQHPCNKASRRFPAKFNIYKKKQPNQTSLHIYLRETYAVEQGQKVGRAEPPSPPAHTFWFPKKPLKDEFDNTFDIGDFRAHIFCPQTNQERAEKHHEARPPEQLPTNAFSQIDYGHTRHCEDCKEVCLCQRTTQN